MSGHTSRAVAGCTSTCWFSLIFHVRSVFRDECTKQARSQEYLFIYLFIYSASPINYMYMKTTNQNSHIHTHTHTRTHTHRGKEKNPVWQGHHNSFRQLLWARSLKKNYKRRIRSKTAFHWLCQTPSYVAFGTN